MAPPLSTSKPETVSVSRRLRAAIDRWPALLCRCKPNPFAWLWRGGGLNCTFQPNRKLREARQMQYCFSGSFLPIALRGFVAFLYAEQHTGADEHLSRASPGPLLHSVLCNAYRRQTLTRSSRRERLAAQICHWSHSRGTVACEMHNEWTGLGSRCGRVVLRGCGHRCPSDLTFCCAFHSI